MADAQLERQQKDIAQSAPAPGMRILNKTNHQPKRKKEDEKERIRKKKKE